MESKREKVERIKAKIKEKGIKLNACLTEKQVIEYEEMKGTQLPEEYRLFLMEAGNGGTGPYYGLIPLERAELYKLTDEDWEKEENANSKHESRNLSLCHEGCGYFFVLVLDGTHRNEVWHDLRAAGEDLYSLQMGFLDWYEAWLDAGARTMQDLINELISKSDE